MTKFAYENGNAWADLDASGSLTTRRMYLGGLDSLFARIDSQGDVAWYLEDFLGSVRDLTNGTGALQDHIDYDSWGNVTYESNSSFSDRYKYTKREWEAELDLQYNRARFYDPQTRRWISQDPLGFDAGDSNLYRYVNNQPTAMTDPSGFQSLGGYPFPSQKYPLAPPLNPDTLMGNAKTPFQQGYFKPYPSGEFLKEDAKNGLSSIAVPPLVENPSKYDPFLPYGGNPLAMRKFEELEWEVEREWRFKNGMWQLALFVVNEGPNILAAKAIMAKGGTAMFGGKFGGGSSGYLPLPQGVGAKLPSNMKSHFLASPVNGVGTFPQNNGALGGPINTYGISNNCVACVTAVLHNQLRGGLFLNPSTGRWQWSTATTIQNRFGAANSTTIPSSFEAVDYITNNLQLQATPLLQVHSLNNLTQPGHYIFVSESHIVYGRVFQNGATVLYDPQIHEIVTFQQMTSSLRTANFRTFQITVPQGND